MITTEAPSPALPVSRIPRISKLMALAHHFERLVLTGIVKDYAELAPPGDGEPRPYQSDHEPAVAGTGYSGGDIVLAQDRRRSRSHQAQAPPADLPGDGLGEAAGEVGWPKT